MINNFSKVTIVKRTGAECKNNVRLEERDGKYSVVYWINNKGRIFAKQFNTIEDANNFYNKKAI